MSKSMERRLSKRLSASSVATRVRRRASRVLREHPVRVSFRIASRRSRQVTRQVSGRLHRPQSLLVWRCRAEAGREGGELGLLRCRTMPSSVPARRAGFVQQRPRRWQPQAGAAAGPSGPPRRSCYVWEGVPERLPRVPCSHCMGQETTHPASSSQHAQAVAPQSRWCSEASSTSASCLDGRRRGSSTHGQPLKTVEASDPTQRWVEAAAVARRVAQTGSLPAAVGRVEVWAQSSRAAVKAVAARRA